MSPTSLFLIAELPAVPTDSSGRYVAAAYVMFTVLLVVYVAIMAQRLRRVQRLAERLEEQVRTRSDEASADS